jgi:1-phosphatidylinositol-4-phosphate 5-kinase
MTPTIFERLRNLYGISNNDYQRSVGPEYLLNQLLTGDLTALNEKCSTGKSGSFFYLTTDNKIFLKTIPKHEFILFTQIMKNYYEHMINNTNSLIVRIYGLYKLKIYVNKQKINTIYFIAM